MPESQEPGIEKDPRERKLSLKDRIEANKGAGYGAMVGAVSGAIFLGPLAPIGAIIGGAVGGGIGSVIDRKFRRPNKKT